MPRWMLGIAGIAVAVVGAWRGDDLAATVAGLDGRVAAIEERLETRPVGTVEAEGLRFAGEGDAVSEPVPLVAGTALFTLSTDGASLTVLDLLAASGEEDVASYRSIDTREGAGTGTTAAPSRPRGATSSPSRATAPGPWLWSSRGWNTNETPEADATGQGRLRTRGFRGGAFLRLPR